MNSGNSTYWSMEFRGMTSKETELERELKNINIDVAIISETKKKLRGTKDLEHCILFCSGVPQNKRASSGIAVLLNNKYRNRIDTCNFVSDRTLNIKL